MKKFVVIIALTLFLKPIFPVIEYVVNYDYISKVLCVNIDKPVLECNGKCHLKKELAKEADANKPITPDKKVNTSQVEVLFCMLMPTFEMPSGFNLVLSQTNTHYANYYDFATLNSVFHPPTV